MPPRTSSMPSSLSNRLARLTAGLILLLAASPLATYDRSDFGPGWLDPDGNGQNAREDALDAARLVITLWLDPYTGSLVTDPGRLDIDHIVPLSWAWDHGADQWDQGTREAFANDPLNLLPVLAGANRSKGAKGPDEWMPPNVAFWPAYLVRFMAVVERYGLTLTDTERAAIACYRRFLRQTGQGFRPDRWRC